MRTLKIFFRGVLWLAIIAGVGFLISREALLFWGNNQIKQSVNRLRQLSVQREYLKECKDRGSVIIEGETLATLQLRFTSSREYVLEVLCSQYTIDPIVVDHQELPPYVEKVSESSGIIWDAALSGVRLGIWGRTTSVGLEDGSIKTLSNSQPLGVSPVSSCEGYGFTCCHSDAQQGVGAQIEGVTDCPKSCFSSCVSRPLLLSLNTQPALDLKSRTVEVESGQSVIFNYVIDPGQGDEVDVNVDLGDGSSVQFTQEEWGFEHVYSCPQSRCDYQVQLTAVDQFGINTNLLPINRLTVIVKGR